MSPSPATPGSSTLRIGERIVSFCDDGLLASEYALFDPSDAVLHASDPVTVREAGYITTAREAIERLAREGVTAALAEHAAAAMPREIVLAYGRGQVARSLAGRLGPQELFDGAVFRSAARVYEGMWLDLRALSDALEMPDASLLLQALHLAAALGEVVDTAPVHLTTGRATRGRRPGERTYQRPSFRGIADLANVLRHIGPRAMPATLDMAREVRLQPALLARVRERLAGSIRPEARARLATLERALAASFQEAALGAARSSLAAGAVTNARHFASQLIEDPGASDSKRMVAHEILEETSQATDAQAVTIDAPVVEAAAVVVEPAPAPPAAEALPPPAAGPSPPRAPRGGGRAGPRTLDENGPQRDRGAQLASSLRYDPEVVEGLALPAGSSERDLGPSDVVSTPLQARIAMTRLARDLGRDYRQWYGRTLRCDVHAVDTMQQHLLSRYLGASPDNPEVMYELRRHGALFSEILARALGGVWMDVASSEPGYWVMIIPPSVRTCPIGRVIRFVALGRQERDLVSQFLELDAAARRAAKAG
jgi:hypothetical protein